MLLPKFLSRKISPEKSLDFMSQKSVLLPALISAKGEKLLKIRNTPRSQSIDWFWKSCWLIHKSALCTRIALLPQWVPNSRKWLQHLHELMISTKNRVSKSVCCAGASTFLDSFRAKVLWSGASWTFRLCLLLKRSELNIPTLRNKRVCCACYRVLIRFPQKEMGFGQLIIGAPGSGKTTYCHGISQVGLLSPPFRTSRRRGGRGLQAMQRQLFLVILPRLHAHPPCIFVILCGGHSRQFARSCSLLIDRWSKCMFNQYLNSVGRETVVVNLDPGNDLLPYDCAVDVMGK